jgi:hypothetical protein
MICREYLVTSPAAYCANPSADKIEVVELGLRLARLLYRFEDGAGDAEASCLPLILSHDVLSEDSRNPPKALPGPVLFENFLKRIMTDLQKLNAKPESPKAAG